MTHGNELNKLTFKYGNCLGQPFALTTGDSAPALQRPGAVLFNASCNEQMLSPKS